jgi:hypothetical protein
MQKTFNTEIDGIPVKLRVKKGKTKPTLSVVEVGPSDRKATIAESKHVEVVVNNTPTELIGDLINYSPISC